MKTNMSQALPLGCGDPAGGVGGKKPICGPGEGKLKSWGLGLGRKLFGQEADLILWGNQKSPGQGQGLSCLD